MEGIMQNIGLMMTYNEEDIIEETMNHLSKYFDKILVLDGSDDNTPNILRSYKNIVYYLHDDEIFPKRRVRDGARQFLLEEAQKKIRL
jgi:glycosyltransferase involved in cell wall biosynthesis